MIKKIEPKRPKNARYFVDRMLADGAWEMVIPYKDSPRASAQARESRDWLAGRHPREVYRVVDGGAS